MSLHWKHRRVQKANPWGFTLMEMLIVIAIMLLLVIATLPRIKYAMDESKLREGTRQLNSYFSMAKSRAAATGRPCGVMFITEQVGAGSPGTFHSSQLYLAEIPPPYAGDIQEARVLVTDSSGTYPPTAANAPTPGNLTTWPMTFLPAGSGGSLTTLIADGEGFLIRFDHKGPVFQCRRIGNQFYVISGPTIPKASNAFNTVTQIYDPAENPYAGYQYEIVRNAQRIGAPLALPRGTSVDMTYSGFGNSGVEFFTTPNPVMVLFTPAGRVGNVTYSTWNNSTSAYMPATGEANGTLHFLIGRPEKVGLPLPQSNLWSNESLWVSVGRLTGSVTSTDNAPNVNLPYATAPQQQVFLTTAREYAITQDVRGGQ